MPKNAPTSHTSLLKQRHLHAGPGPSGVKGMQSNFLGQLKQLQDLLKESMLDPDEEADLDSATKEEKKLETLQN